MGAAVPPAIVEYVQTADGASIACKRRPTAGGIPIIFLHGLAVNVDLWDIPDIKTAAGTFHSLPATLQELGYDIWLVNLRGHGSPDALSRPPDGQKDWCVDHFIAYDLPAVVEHVREKTGQKPWLIGNSMGAMTIAGYLEGARIAPDEPPHVVADDATAECRQELVRGAVLFEFPAALRWPESLYDADGKLKWSELLSDWRRNDGDVNFPFEMLSRATWVAMLLRASGEVSLRWLRTSDDPGAWRRNLPAPVRDGLKWADDAVMRVVGKAAEAFKGSGQFQPELFKGGFLRAIDHMKAGVLEQMGKSVRARGFVSGLGPPDYVYSDHYDRIASPLLVLVGGRDRIANAAVVREVLIERVASPDTTFEEFEEIAHGDFEWTPITCEKVYPIVVDWIRQRDAADKSSKVD